jgi:hypothetical protein
MKKVALSVLLVVFLAFALGAQTPAQQPQPPKPEDIQKKLVLVDKPQTAPDKMKVGFETITAKDSIALLTYLASDLMEGRETATRGYQLASEYAASLFALWTGEEEGLLGSRYYVMNPAFPMDKTVAYINMDMISRPYTEQNLTMMARRMNFPTDSEAFKKVKVSNFLPVAFSAGAGLGDTVRNMDQYVGLDLYLRESEGGLDRSLGGSDHSSFASAKVPWVFVITSMHEDYHQTSDSVEKVNGDMMAKIARLIYLTAYSIADK